MIKNINKIGFAFALFLASTLSAHAVIIDNSIEIPDDVLLLNFNNTGLDWVYAGPIAPNEFGLGNIQPASYRANEGWRVATASEWSARPEWFDFIVPGFEVGFTPIATWTDHTQYLFAPEYWSNFTHVDINDFADGRVTDGVNGVVTVVPETIYVRNSRSQEVSAPSAFAIFSISLIGFAMMRRK